MKHIVVTTPGGLDLAKGFNLAATECGIQLGWNTTKGQGTWIGTGDTCKKCGALTLEELQRRLSESAAMKASIRGAFSQLGKEAGGIAIVDASVPAISPLEERAQCTNGSVHEPKMVHRCDPTERRKIVLWSAFCMHCTEVQGYTSSESEPTEFTWFVYRGDSIDE